MNWSQKSMILSQNCWNSQKPTIRLSWVDSKKSTLIFTSNWQKGILIWQVDRWNFVLYWNLISLRKRLRNAAISLSEVWKWKRADSENSWTSHRKLTSTIGWWIFKNQSSNTFYLLIIWILQTCCRYVVGVFLLIWC